MASKEEKLRREALIRAKEEEQQRRATLKEDLLAKREERERLKAAGVAEERPLAKLEEAEKRIGEEVKAEEEKAAKKPWYKFDWGKSKKQLAVAGGVAAGAGAVAGGAAVKAVKYVSQSSLALALLISLANYYFKFKFGGGVIILHIITATIFILMMKSKLWRSLAFVPLALEVLPLLLPDQIGGWVLISPWWAFYILAAILNDIMINGFTWKGTKYVVIAAAALIIVFGAPQFGGAAVQTTLQQKEALTSIASTTMQYVGTTAKYWSGVPMSIYCSVAGDFVPSCQELKKTEEKAVVKVVIDKNLPIMADAQMVSYQKETPFSKTFDQYISAVNNQDKDYTIELSCELKDFEKGSITPWDTHKMVPRDTIRERVTCTFEKTLVRAHKTLEFTSILKGIESTSIKELNFMDEATLKSIENEYLKSRNPPKLAFADNDEENAFLLDHFKGQVKSEIKTTTSDEFVLLPIQEEKGVVNPKEKSLLIYGAKKDEKIPFKLYVQRNEDKKGEIVKVNNINIQVPPGWRLDPENCGYGDSYLATVTNWTKILPGEGNQFSGLRSCDLVAGSDIGTTPNPVSITATINYDYAIKEKTEVTAT